MLEKCVLTILELNWNQHSGHKKTKINICHYMLTSSTQLQNRSFHVAERTRTSTKCQKMKNARAKRAKILFFIVKYANLWGFCCRRLRGCLSSLMVLYPPDKSLSRERAVWNDCRITNTITIRAGANSEVNQSEILITCNLLKGWEKSRVQDVLVMVLLSIGWKTGVRFWSQSLSYGVIASVSTCSHLRTVLSQRL